MSLLMAFATKEELCAVLLAFNRRGRGCCAIPEAGEARYFPMNGKDALLLITGVGPLNAAFNLGRTLGRHPEVTGVLNLGLAGSFDLERAPLGAVVRVSEEICPEYGVAAGTGAGGGVSLPDDFAFPMLPATEASGGQDVWNRIDLMPAEGKAFFSQLELSALEGLVTGASVSVGAVTGDTERARELALRYAPLVENMEGFALALGARRAGLPFLELRGVSNQVGERSKGAWSISQAMENLGAAARGLL